MSKRKIRIGLFLILFVMVFAILPNTAEAATKKHKNEWVSINDNMYYYNANGVRVKDGLKKIGNSTYYFDANGVQHVGWQKINNNYYFFQRSYGRLGFRRQSRTVNGIELNSKGKAVLTAAAKTKLNVLVKANKLVEKNTKPMWTKSKKLKTMWNVVMKYQYRGSLDFTYSSQWECKYAMDMYTSGHGSCYNYGAAFAFFANACGYSKSYAVSSGGHGWAEVGGYIYDPSWQIVDGRNHSYFHLDPNLSGQGGIPSYKRSRVYVKLI